MQNPSEKAAKRSAQGQKPQPCTQENDRVKAQVELPLPHIDGKQQGKQQRCQPKPEIKRMGQIMPLSAQYPQNIIPQTEEDPEQAGAQELKCLQRDWPLHPNSRANRPAGFGSS